MPKLGFAPVQTQGIFDIRVKANEEILKTLEKAKLIEKDPEDGEYYLRKKGAWRKRLDKALKENDWDYYPTIENNFITWYILNEEERLEEFLRDLDRYIEQISDVLDFKVEVEV